MKTKFTLISVLILLLTLAFKPTNAQVFYWMDKLYNSVDNLSDKATATAIDNNCNIYVTGQSDKIGSGANYVTIKYDVNGDIAWKTEYDGPAHLDDIPTAIKIDTDGNVYVTGKSGTASNGFDFLTVKYNSAGVQQWASRYNGSANADDIANDLAIDAVGNVYVCGNQGNGSALIKYNSTGNQMWFNTNAPSGNYQFHYYKVKIANSGDINVLGDYLNTNNGYGGTANEIRLYHYSSTGYSSMSNWVLGYGPFDPRPVDFVLNSTGDAFIGTYCKESGDENIYVLSTKNMNSIFCKYNPSGTGNSRISAIKLDNSGNVYVAGFTDINTGSAIDLNYLMLKFNSSGVQQWMQTYGGTGEDVAIDMAIGSGSNPDVFLTGYNTNDLGNKDIVTIKYNNSGALQSNWTQTNGYGSYTDHIPVGMKIDGFNNIIISGYRGNLNSEDITTLKYGANLYSANINWTGLNTYTASAGSAYQWYFNNNAVNGANQQTLNATLIGNGSYYCMVKQYCCVHKSNTLSGFVGLDELPSYISAIVYPNPTNGYFSVTYQLPENKEGELKIFNTSGKLIYKTRLPVSSTIQEIKLSTMSDGIYNCVVSAGNYSVNRKVVVLK